MDPARLVWRRDLIIDLIPYHVRDPIVFAYAIQHYIPEYEFGGSVVLRKRRPGERIPVTFWRDRLGTTTELGTVPAYSKGIDHDRCESGGSCVDYAIVSGPKVERGKKVQFRIDGTAGPYAVTLSTRKHQRTYAVRLDRLWFWPLIGKPTSRLTSQTPEWTVQRVSVDAGDDLY